AVLGTDMDPNTTGNTIGEGGKPVYGPKKPDLRWYVVAGHRVNDDYTTPPSLVAKCCCGQYVFTGPNATEQEVKHCGTWSVVRHGIGSGKFTLRSEKCPQELVKQYLEMYSAWERRHKPKKLPKGTGYSSYDRQRDEFFAA